MIKREYKPRAPLYSRPMQSHAVKSMRVYPANIRGEPVHIKIGNEINNIILKGRKSVTSPKLQKKQRTHGYMIYSTFSLVKTLFSILVSP